MRLIKVLNIVLLFLSLTLLVLIWWCGRHALIGANIKGGDVVGKCLCDVIIGQPVFPDRVHIALNGDFVELIYESDSVFLQRHPSVVVQFFKGHADAVEVRKR